MVIEVRQTRSKRSDDFKIFCDDKLQYTGAQSGSSRYPSIYLYQLEAGEQLELEGRSTRRGATLYQFINLIFCVGVLFLWNIMPNLLFKIIACIVLFFLLALLPIKSKVCIIHDGNNKRIARFRHIGKGLLTAYDVIEAGDKEYRIYNKARGHFLYLSIYMNGKQIAQVNKDLHTVNNKDNYQLYLLDEEMEIAELLIMFILYYDSHNYGNYGEAFVGYKKNWKWTWSKTDRYYDESWLPSHFGWDKVEDHD